ncbi:MAG: penicillin-insensitive murein endopeptidase [Polyangia bacterium]
MLDREQGAAFTVRTTIAMALLAAVASSAAGPPAEQSSPGTLSVGTPMNGSLERGEVLPRRGSGYRMMSTTRQRRARFGVHELVMLIKWAAHRVYARHPGSTLMVGDLSVRKGGPIEHHGSHQNGRDVDFAFYMIDGDGEPVTRESFVAFDANGFSVDPPMRYRFDTERNWALVRELLQSDSAVVQWIFIADHLEDLLLAHAEEAGESPLLRRRAEHVLHEPTGKSHWDHFHVRIYCPPDDGPRCSDVGPRWAWTRRP